jgi:hypothetical protein
LTLSTGVAVDTSVITFDASNRNIKV